MQHLGYNWYNSEPRQPRYYSLVSLNKSRVLLVGSCALLKVRNLQQFVKCNKKAIDISQNVPQQSTISPKVCCCYFRVLETFQNFTVNTCTKSCKVHVAWNTFLYVLTLHTQLFQYFSLARWTLSIWPIQLKEPEKHFLGNGLKKHKNG